MPIKKRAEIMGVLIIFSVALITLCEASGFDANVEESRGKKKKKIGLLVFFADIVLKKIFIFKIVYAIIFGLLIHKAGYFLSWFITYLIKQKKEHPVEHYPSHHHEYEPPHDYSSYGPYKRTNQKPKQEYLIASSSNLSPYSYYARS